MAWIGMDFKDHESLTSLPGRATNLHLDQDAQGPIQPGLEHLQEQDSLFQHLSTLPVKSFPLKSHLPLIFSSLV